MKIPSSGERRLPACSSWQLATNIRLNAVKPETSRAFGCAVGQTLWVARASRTWATASRRRELFENHGSVVKLRERQACFGETPKPTRETRALPRFNPPGK